SHGDCQSSAGRFSGLPSLDAGDRRLVISGLGLQHVGDAFHSTLPQSASDFKAVPGYRFSRRGRTQTLVGRNDTVVTLYHAREGLLGSAVDSEGCCVEASAGALYPRAARPEIIQGPGQVDRRVLRCLVNRGDCAAGVLVNAEIPIDSAGGGYEGQPAALGS